MKPNHSSRKLTAALAATALLAASGSLTAQITAVEFGGNYNDTNDNADTSGYVLEKVDFDGEADANDRSSQIPLGNPVAGSTLADIQAFGALIQQNDIASARGVNADLYAVNSFSARMVQLASLPTDPIRVVNKAQRYDNINTDGSFTHTLPDFPVVANEHRKLIVAISFEAGASVTGITYGNDPVPENRQKLINAAAFGGGQKAEIWYLDDPALGLADIEVTFSAANTRSRMAVLSVSGAADGFGPVKSGGAVTTDSLSLDLTTDSTDTLVVACFNSNSTSPQGVITTPTYEETIASGDAGSSRADAGYVRVADPAITNFTWTITQPQTRSAVVVGFPAEPGFVQPPLKSLQNFSIPKVTTAPTIDGTFSAGEWDNAFQLDMKYPELGILPNYGGFSNNPVSNFSPADISGTLHFTWDATYLYVGFDIADADFIAPPPGGDGFPDDHILFGFNPDASTTGLGTTFLAEFFINSDGVAEGFFRTDLADNNLNQFANHNLAGSTDAQGWNFEMRLKWTDIKGNGSYVPAINDLFGAAILLCDNDVDDGERDVFLYSAGAGDTGVMIKPSIWHNVTLASDAPANTFANWIAGFPGVGAETGFNDDSDKDGNKNGIENFFGTPPDVFSEGLISGGVNTVTNTFTFTHPVNATPAGDLTATYRWSTDLTTFHDDGVSNAGGTTTVTFTPGTPSGGKVTVKAVITGSVIPRRLFVGLKVTQ